MAEGTIREPFELGYCDQCINHDNDQFGSKCCSLNTSTPIRKIKECDYFLHYKIAMLDAFKNKEG